MTNPECWCKPQIFRECPRCDTGVGRGAAIAGLHAMPDDTGRWECKHGLIPTLFENARAERVCAVIVHRHAG